VHAVEGTYAARRAPAVLREAESVVDVLQRLLVPPAKRRVRLDIFLIDPVPAGRAAQSTEQNVVPANLVSSNEPFRIVREIQPEAPGEPLAGTVTRRLLAAWYGLAVPAVLVDGISGYVMCLLDPSIDLAHSDAQLRQELARGRNVDLLRRLGNDVGSAGDSAGLDPIATSYVSYLVNTYGAAALGRFLAEYDPTRRDQAALGAFRRTLGATVEAWLGTVRRVPGPSDTLRSFSRQMVPLLRPYWRRQLEVLVYIIYGLAYSLAVPLSGKYLVDTVIPSGSGVVLARFVIVLLAIYVADALIRLRRAYVSAGINQRVSIDLQEQMFARLLRLPHEFYARAQLGDLMARFSNDLQIVQQTIVQVVDVGLTMALTAVVAMAVMLSLSPILGVLVLAVVPLFALVYYALRSRLELASVARQQFIGESLAAVEENLSAHAVVKAYGLESQALTSYHSRLLALFKAALSLEVTGALFETSANLAVALGQLIVLGGGGYLALQGQLTVGTLVAFIGLLPSLFVPVAALSGVGRMIQMASGALGRVRQILSERESIADRPGARPLPPLSQEIHLEHVTFAYEGGPPVLDDIDLTITAGSNVAIVGRSGSGKSTIASLLMRFYDPTAGRIVFDGADLTDVALASVREQIGIVFQDTFVFNTTIRANIAIGRPNATDAEIVGAARAARLDEYVQSLPSGLDTILGERGVRMSGGQRQRLALARVLLRNPRILILDEATSALDAQTEREVRETLAEVTRGRTTISITHRLALAVAADRIIVLDQGHVVEQGTHAELLAAGGLYRHLFREQTGLDVSTSPATEPGLVELRQMPLFAGLTERVLTDLAGQMTMEQHEPGDIVVREGDPGDRLYLIVEGQVEVVRRAPSGERRLNLLTSGDYFGEMALLAGESRNATVRTTTSTRLYTLSRGTFQGLLDREPALQQLLQETYRARAQALVDARMVEVEADTSTGAQAFRSGRGGPGELRGSPGPPSTHAMM
jgi:ABC-type multidrug transport system fused ATPase/permease subunit